MHSGRATLANDSCPSKLGFKGPRNALSWSRRTGVDGSHPLSASQVQVTYSRGGSALSAGRSWRRPTKCRRAHGRQRRKQRMQHLQRYATARVAYRPIRKAQAVSQHESRPLRPLKVRLPACADCSTRPRQHVPGAPALSDSLQTTFLHESNQDASDSFTAGNAE